MDNNIEMYNRAIKDLMSSPVQGPHGTYHVKNGIIYYGYHIVSTENFATSDHCWNIFH